MEVAASLSEVDWEQPSRFRRLHDRWGPWGLALLEAIVRQADHAVSAGGAGRGNGESVKTEVICRGLPASWINAWLAAVGATVLSPRLRLRWTDDSTPRAALSAENGDPVEMLLAAWPSRTALDGLPIAERWSDTPPVARRVTVESFAARCARRPFSSLVVDAVLHHDGPACGRWRGGGACAVRPRGSGNDQVAA